MRIGADGSFLRWRRTGIARYLDGLLHSLAEQLPATDELVVYYNATKAEPLFGPRVRERFVRMPTATLWNQVRVPLAIRRDECDVYLGGALVVPTRSKAATVVVVHDCMSFRFPESKSRHASAYLRRWTRASAQQARVVVCSSAWGAHEAETYLGIGQERIRVIPCAVDPSFRPVDPNDLPRLLAEIQSRLGVRSPYVLQVGGFELHKGGPTAIGAIELLRQQGHDVTLVRCGIPGPEQRRGSGTVDLGFVDDQLLRSLYQCATAVCVASTHEGFGLPVLEAMASGTPVVAARAAALPEVGSDIALYAEPGDVGGFAAALELLLADDEEPVRRRRDGLLHAASFTWDRTARSMLEVLREAYGSRRPD